MIGSWLDKLRDIRRRKTWTVERANGRRGEDLAHRFLKRQGFKIVARNYRTASGGAEADLIAWERDILSIVEVKTRASEDFGPPERAIGEAKRLHLLRAARGYVHKTEIPWDRVRFDVVTVILSDPPEITLIRDALPNAMRATV